MSLLNNQCYRATEILCIISFENVSITNVRSAMGATSEAGTVVPSGAHGFIPVFGGIRVNQSLVCPSI